MGKWVGKKERNRIITLTYSLIAIWLNVLIDPFLPNANWLTVLIDHFTTLQPWPTVLFDPFLAICKLAYCFDRSCYDTIAMEYCFD